MNLSAIEADDALLDLLGDEQGIIEALCPGCAMCPGPLREWGTDVRRM